MIPSSIFKKMVSLYKSDKHCYTYMTYDQLCSMMFGQLNSCHSLREIALGIDQSPEFLYDIGLQQSPAKSTMSDGNTRTSYVVQVESVTIKSLRLFTRSYSDIILLPFVTEKGVKSLKK